MKSVDDMTAFRTVTRNAATGENAIEVVRVAEMTPSGFRLARVPAWLGRGLEEGDAFPGAVPVVVIGADVWRGRFGSDPGVIGRPLKLGAATYTIVGVMPAGFAFPVNHEFWVPLITTGAETARGTGPSVFIAGRLARGSDLNAANAELTTIGERMAAAFPETHGQLRPEVLPYTYPFAGMSRSSADGFWPASLLVSLILVVVCVNVAILIYARTATRLPEIAMRSALGASRVRIVTQFLVESFVLSTGAAVAGLVVVRLALGWARSSMASLDQSTFWSDYTIPGPAVAYAVALTIVAGVVTGIAPALRASRGHVQTDLRHFTSATSLRLGRTWTTLIVTQVSIASAALPIAIGLGWFQIRDIFNLPAFPVEQILFAEVGLDRELSAGLPAEAGALASRFARLQTELSRRLEAEPGVASYSFTLDLPNIGRPGRIALENDPWGGGLTRQIQPSTVDTRFSVPSSWRCLRGANLLRATPPRARRMSSSSTGRS